MIVYNFAQAMPVIAAATMEPMLNINSPSNKSVISGLLVSRLDLHHNKIGAKNYRDRGCQWINVLPSCREALILRHYVMLS